MVNSDKGKCKCVTVQHNHPNNRCDRLATENDGYCKECHDYDVTYLPAGLAVEVSVFQVIAHAVEGAVAGLIYKT